MIQTCLVGGKSHHGHLLLLKEPIGISENPLGMFPKVESFWNLPLHHLYLTPYLFLLCLYSRVTFPLCVGRNCPGTLPDQTNSWINACTFRLRVILPMLHEPSIIPAAALRDLSESSFPKVANFLPWPPGPSGTCHVVS